MLKTFFNGRKIPVIPSLLIDGKLVSDLRCYKTSSREQVIQNKVQGTQRIGESNSP